MSEDEIITELYSLLHLNTYINLCEQMELSVKIPKRTLEKWKDNCNSLLDLYQEDEEIIKRLNTEYETAQGYILALKKSLEQEKEKNKELSEKLTEQICNKVEVEVLEEYRLKLKNSISKDKIRAKIKELEEKSDYWNCDEIEVLKELLERR